MLAKCSNPACSATFHYLHEGKLFPIELRSDSAIVASSTEGYWKTIEEDFHWHLEILPQLIGLTGFERASWFFCNPVPPETAARCLSC
jgi:hypothetical protein